MDEKQQIGARLKHLRKQQQMTQEVVAQKMGMARTTIVAIEQGKRPLNPYEVARFAILYGVQATEIATEIEKPTESVKITGVHVYIGYHYGKARKGERCFYCQSKAPQFAYTYFGAPICAACWDDKWRQTEDGQTDPPFAKITNTTAGFWV